jgi:UDP-N-acetylmuramoyl-tripeptide--D-alanyl-D-alanine ligase
VSEPFETKFSLGKLRVRSGLVGRHNVGVVAAAVGLARKLGLSDTEIKKGLANLKPFEHRMEPKILNGAVIIDDTYNGNLSGVKAGVDLARELNGFKRKIYITPGLVEQGDKTREIHVEIGELLANVFDQVVLMKNSVANYIIDGLRSNGFEGELLVIDDPLNFYQNLDKMVALGDLVLMQNDWTDNYY